MIRLGLDKEDFKLNYDTIKIHFTSLWIELLTHKQAALFWQRTKIGQKQGIKSKEKFYNVKCAITDIYDLYLYFYWLLTLQSKY